MKQILSIAFGIMVLTQIVAWKLAPATFGTDFFPLWWAAQRLIHGEPVYGSAATRLLAQQWGASEPYASGGMAYPIPLVLLATPFTVLPFRAAVIIYNGISLLALMLGMRRLNRAAVWFLPTPAIVLGIALGQTSTIILAGMLWWVVAVREQRWHWVVLLALLCLLKPTMGILVWCWTAILLYRHWSIIPRSARSCFIGGTISGGITLLAWGEPWLQQLIVYNQAINTDAFPTWSLLVIGGLSLFGGVWASLSYHPANPMVCILPCRNLGLSSTGWVLTLGKPGMLVLNRLEFCYQQLRCLRGNEWRFCPYTISKMAHQERWYLTSSVH